MIVTKIKKKLLKIRRLYKIIKVMGVIFGVLVKILGPAMSLYLFIDDQMQKKQPKKSKKKLLV